jgi:membrane associated rhomboid family serine protease
MGAYARLYPKAHVHTLIFLGIFITTVSLPAYVMLGYWFVIQLLEGIPATAGNEGGVAFWAHVGGFIAGVLLVKPLHRPDFLRQHNAQQTIRTARHRFF